MYNCTEYAELISAYTDGELAENEVRHLEAHLGICPDCSPILEAYRGISHAINESCVPAPETLSSGVMERIAGEDPVRIAANMKKYKLVNIIMTRYVPAAACLVFLLLTVPRFIGSRGPISESDSASVPMSASVSGADQRTAASGAGGAAAPGGGSADYDRGSADLTIPEESEMSAADDDSPAPTQAPAPPASDAAPEIALNEADTADTAGDAYARDDSTGSSEPDSQSTEMFADAGNTEAEGGGAAAPTQSLYAIIRITGRMPAILEEYETESSGASGERLFEIPREAAKELLDEIAESGRVTVDLIDENGAYALVYYTP